MKISIVTTITNPEVRQDPWMESIFSYLDLADEVIVVDGSELMSLDLQSLVANIGKDKLKVIKLPWPQDWNWKELPLHINAGFAAATGDWIIKMDIDQMFHENDMSELRRRLMKINKPVASFQKMSVLPNKRFLQKGEIMTAIKKEYFGKIQFGEALDRDTDLCHPIWVTIKGEVPKGNAVKFNENEMTRTGISIWNFDYTFKTQEFVQKEFVRFSLAYEKYFGGTSWGRTPEESFSVFMNMMEKRYKNATYRIVDSSVLPKYIRKKYHDLTPEQFGHSGWGLL